MQRAAPRVGNASPSATSDAGREAVRGRAFGLPRERRIRKRAEFRAVYDRGFRRGSKFFTVFLLATRSGRPARMGLTVTRKIGNAATRNRCKRLLREAVRKQWDLLPDGTDMVLHARPGLVDAKAGDVEREIARTLPRVVRRLTRPVRRRGKRKRRAAR